MTKELEEKIHGFAEMMYKVGYADGIKDGNINDNTFAEKVNEAYRNGLYDAWACVGRMERLLFADSLRPIFGEEDFYTLVTKHSAAYCIEKLKEYDKKQKSDNPYQE